METFDIAYRPMGVPRTPHAQAQGASIQPSGARGMKGQDEIAPEYVLGLKDLEGLSHLILLYHCHLSGACQLLVRLMAVQDNILELEDVDMLDGSPPLDVKPCVPAFDAPQGELRLGWLSQRASQADQAKADGRFA